MHVTPSLERALFLWRALCAAHYGQLSCGAADSHAPVYRGRMGERLQRGAGGSQGNPSAFHGGLRERLRDNRESGRSQSSGGGGGGGGAAAEGKVAAGPFWPDTVGDARTPGSQGPPSGGFWAKGQAAGGEPIERTATLRSCSLPPPPPPPLCDMPAGCSFFTGPWTVTRSSLRVLRRDQKNWFQKIPSFEL